MSLHPPLRRGWPRRGQRKLIPAPGTPLRLHVFGAYHWHSDRVTYLTDRRKHGNTFIRLLEHLLVATGDKKIVWVMDNAAYHRCKTVEVALSVWEERIMVLWWPKYNPFLNPIERCWLHFKQLAVANWLHRSLKELNRAVDEVMANQNKGDHPNRLMLSTNFQLVA